MKIGLQLYSVRDKMEEDFEGTLKAVAEMGYDCVEFAGFYDRSAEEIKAMLDKYGLEAVSVHQGLDFMLEKGKENIDFIKKLGVKYAAIPWMEREYHKGGEGYAKTLEKIKKLSKEIKESGIELLYHNHEMEYNLYEGKPLIDWFFDTLDKDIINPEFDLGWVKFAGYDPCGYLKNYSDRCSVIHLKDFVVKYEGTAPDDHRRMIGKSIGTGVQDVKAIMKAAEEAGAEIAIVENENGENIGSLDMAKESCAYLKSIGY